MEKHQQSDSLRYLKILAKQYPTVQSAAAEIIRLQAVLNLPKGTEHFMSDLHGEYEAFLHILNNASGVIREKVDLLFSHTLPASERASLATLIYYTDAKLEEIRESCSDPEEWYRITLNRLLEVCRLVASKYTRARVREALPADFADILDELLHLNYDVRDKGSYYDNIISSVIGVDQADAFIIAVCDTIKRLAVDRLHIVGDIFDRGPRPDIILDRLMEHHSVDIQWGNHDILWMGAAAGSRTCIANVLNNSINYGNLEVIETGYGINLRPLALFANEVYSSVDTSCFRGKASKEHGSEDLSLIARMHKAIAVILFKLEGQIIRRNPSFRMEERLLLDKIDRETKTVTVEGKVYPIRDCDLPTVDPADPCRLSPEEKRLMEQLRFAFQQSEKLQRHVKFLYSKGGMYLCCNQNLLFHGCIPMEEDGSFRAFPFEEGPLAGRAFLDRAEELARQGYYARPGTAERQRGKDFLWYLWCGSNSPLYGRSKMASFERLLIDDPAAWQEKKDAYYRHAVREETCLRILRDFGLGEERSHIINGHVPVKSKDGESPIRANGRLIVIDGGFCRAYQSQTGIAGYTLIYSSYGMRISSHEPFSGVDDAIQHNKDILSTAAIFETADARIKVAETDEGKLMQESIDDLTCLLRAYRDGRIKEHHEALPHRIG
ncbi:MAG: fructose-1,6-bisphosphatase [Oscillospiraceae bacterium]|nr:fructose-1,6-bisphosphatase [Oscillospiraceae bacterium]